jgi:hypothetical protein
LFFINPTIVSIEKKKQDAKRAAKVKQRKDEFKLVQEKDQTEQVRTPSNATVSPSSIVCCL